MIKDEISLVNYNNKTMFSYILHFSKLGIQWVLILKIKTLYVHSHFQSIFNFYAQTIHATHRYFETTSHIYIIIILINKYLLSYLINFKYMTKYIRFYCYKLVSFTNIKITNYLVILVKVKGYTYPALNLIRLAKSNLQRVLLIVQKKGRLFNHVSLILFRRFLEISFQNCSISMDPDWVP